MHILPPIRLFFICLRPDGLSYNLHASSVSTHTNYPHKLKAQEKCKWSEFEWNVCDTGMGRCAQAFWLEVQKCELETKAEKICMLKPVGLTTRNNIFIIPLKFSLFKATHIYSAGLCTLTNSFFFTVWFPTTRNLEFTFTVKSGKICDLMLLNHCTP